MNYFDEDDLDEDDLDDDEDEDENFSHTYQQKEEIMDNSDFSISIDNTAPAKIIGIPLFLMGLGLGLWGMFAVQNWTIVWSGVGIILLGMLASVSLRVAGQYESAVVMRLGALRSVHIGEIFFLVPFIDEVIDYVDNRTRSSRFNAEKVLTKDTVPVNADAILFWLVVDAQKATLEVSNYERMILQAAQAALRDIIGQSSLSTVLSDSKNVAEQLQAKIATLTSEWGIDLKSVELRDVQIPEGLQEAMSKEAQAEREKKARVILSEAEGEIADNFAEAAKTYAGTPGALELRGMSLLYEGMQGSQSNTIVIPTAAANTMGMESTIGIAKAVAQNQTPKA